MQLSDLKARDNIQLREEWRNTLQQPDAIDRHPERTPGRDQAAAWIDQHIIGPGRWPVPATDIEQEMKGDEDYTGPSSRQHITNVLESYFQSADTTGKEPQTNGRDTKPMSQSPPQPHIENKDRGHDETKPQVSAGETIEVMVRTDGRFQRVSLTVPDDLESPADGYIRGYFDGLEQ
jgi:hypothetical protein